jgi:hypothetical protein
LPRWRPGGPLYQIDDEQVSENGYDRKSAVSVVLDNCEELLKYIAD